MAMFIKPEMKTPAVEITWRLTTYGRLCSLIIICFGTYPTRRRGEGGLSPVSRRIGQLPGKCQDVPRNGFQNFRIECVGGVGGLVKVWMNPAAHNGDGRHTGLFERHVIAAGEESIEIEFITESSGLACFGRHAFFESRYAHGEPPIADTRMVDVNHADR